MISKKFCPRCKSENVELAAGGMTGIFECQNCGYSGSIFPEKLMTDREMENIGKKSRKK